MKQDISGCIRMYQDVSGCIRLVLTRTKIKVLKYPAGFPHSLMFCPILYIIYIYIYLCIDINMTHINTHDLPPNSPHKKPRFPQCFPIFTPPPLAPRHHQRRARQTIYQTSLRSLAEEGQSHAPTVHSGS